MLLWLWSALVSTLAVVFYRPSFFTEELHVLRWSVPGWAVRLPAGVAVAVALAAFGAWVEAREEQCSGR